MQKKIPPAAIAISSFLNYPKVILGKFKGVFKPFEKKILAEALSRINNEECEVLRSQIKEINYIQYVKGGGRSELNFYKLSLLKPITDRNVVFQSKGSTFELLSLRFFFNESNDYKFARLYVVNGNFFSIECDFLIDLYRERESLFFIN